MDTIAVSGEKEAGLVVDKPIALRVLLRDVLNRSYNGHNEGCFDCAEINEMVDHFLQYGSFKVYKIVEIVEDTMGRYIDFEEHGHFLRKEFATEKISELESKTEGCMSNRHSYSIEEVDVQI